MTKGFSLLEILVIMAIMAVLAVVAAPNFFNYKSQQDLTLTSREIVSVLRNAQDRAISEGVSYGVFFNNVSSGPSYVQFWGASYQVGTTTRITILRSDIRFSMPAAGVSSTVVFSSRTGLPATSTMIIISLLSNANTSSTIFVSGNGKIQF